MWCKAFIILCLVSFSYASPAKALTLAIFPIEDLSQGQNGVNAELTDYLAWDMTNDRGFDVIANETILAFMARNRLRQLGFMDTKQIVLAKEEMGADMVLFGTMSLRQESLSPSLGLTLYLVRTNDTRTIWTGSGGLSGQDIVNLLAIGEEEDRQGLLPRLAQDVLKTWPTELDFVSKEQHALEIEKIELSPTHVRRGDKVVCKVGLRTSWAEEDMPRVFFKASGRVYMAEQSKDGYSFQSDWLVADRDGRYPVTMVINWPSGHKKVAFLGAYVVDSTPPRVVLDLKGVQLQGTVAFRDKVIIIPRMLRREPVARWKLTVEDENGEEQMSYTGYGQMPRRFVWDGKKSSGWPVEEGLYRVSLKVWDRAENMGITSQPVAVARTPPSMVLEAKNRGREMIVDLSHEGKVPIAFWRMEMRSSNGELIKVAEGSDLPIRMDVGMPNKLIKVADGLRPPSAEGNFIRVAEDQDGKLIRVAEDRDGNLITVDDGRGGRLIKVAEGERGRLIRVAEDQNGKLIRVAEDQNGKLIRVAEGQDGKVVRVAEDQNGKLIRVAEDQDGKVIRVAEDQNGKLIRVAEGQDWTSKVIKVAEGQDGKGKVIRVAVGQDGNGKVIKVADGQDGNGRVIKVADGMEGHPPNRKVIKVAEGADDPAINRRVIKVAEGMGNPPPNKRIIRVAGGDPLIMDVARPEDKDTRKVECTVVLRDVLGNYSKEKIEDLAIFIEQKEREKTRSEPTSAWVEEF